MIAGGLTETVEALVEPTSVAPPLPEGALLAGRFRLGEVLGSGGYGVVYRAVDETAGVPVAIKALRRDRLTASGCQRLTREASLLSGLDHPHLVKVLGAGEGDGVAYLAMELVEGESLRERMQRGPLAVDEATRVAGEVLAGLAALHARGIVHRDVKPGNVLLDGAGSAKLADFGLVRRFDADATRATSSLAVVGTAEYLSPEQALGEELDGRSDLYSLGVVLFEMLAGRPVHERRSTFATVLARLSEAAPDLRELRPEVPAWLAEVVGRLLEKESAKRYASAEAVLADLAARRMPAGALRRRLLRGAWLAAGAALVVGTLVGVTLVVHWRAGFDQLVVAGPEQVVAVDRAGRTLWTRQGFNSMENFLAVRTGPGNGLRIAALLARQPEAYGSTARHRIALLDPQRGEVVEELALPSAAALYPGHEDRYGTRMRVLDVDGDGIDELFVTYNHLVSWPSYTVLWEPRQRRSRVLFAAAGHHAPAAAVDVDGDGHREALFAGVANRQGWYLGLAAVPLRPWIDQPQSRIAGGSQASTPDEHRVPESVLLWYALLPRGFAASERPVAPAPDGKGLVVRYGDGRELRLTLDGFLATEPAGGLAPKARREARGVAYEELRAARRLLGGGFATEALAGTRRALEAARAAADPRLAEWSERVALSALVASGRGAEAEALAARLVATSDAAPEIAWDLARALHLRGEIEAAVRWYRRGLGPGSQLAAGRRAWEFLEGAVIALAGRGRFAEAEEIVARQIEAMPGELAQPRLYLEWCRLRGGRPVRRDVVTVPLESVTSDFAVFALAELDLASGRDAAAVLAGLERMPAKADDEAFFLDWARASAWSRLGRPAEAREALRLARERAERAAATDPAAASAVPLLRATPGAG